MCLQSLLDVGDLSGRGVCRKAIGVPSIGDQTLKAVKTSYERSLGIFSRYHVLCVVGSDQAVQTAICFHQLLALNTWITQQSTVKENLMPPVWKGAHSASMRDEHKSKDMTRSTEQGKAMTLPSADTMSLIMTAKLMSIMPLFKPWCCTRLFELNLPEINVLMLNCWALITLRSYNNATLARSSETFLGSFHTNPLCIRVVVCCLPFDVTGPGLYKQDGLYRVAQLHSIRCTSGCL